VNPLLFFGCFGPRSQHLLSKTSNMWHTKHVNGYRFGGGPVHTIS